MNSIAGCLLCGVHVPTGEVLLVLRGQLTQGGQVKEAQQEGLMCGDRTACTDRTACMDLEAEGELLEQEKLEPEITGKTLHEYTFVLD